MIVDRFHGKRIDRVESITIWQTALKMGVGTSEWRLPIPIVKGGDGWRFDVQAGAEEIRIQRIGNNVFSTMSAALACREAQWNTPLPTAAMTKG